MLKWLWRALCLLAVVIFLFSPAFLYASRFYAQNLPASITAAHSAQAPSIARQKENITLHWLRNRSNTIYASRQKRHLPEDDVLPLTYGVLPANIPFCFVRNGQAARPGPPSFDTVHVRCIASSISPRGPPQIPFSL